MSCTTWLKDWIFIFTNHRPASRVISNWTSILFKWVEWVFCKKSKTWTSLIFLKVLFFVSYVTFLWSIYLDFIFFASFFPHWRLMAPVHISFPKHFGLSLSFSFTLLLLSLSPPPSSLSDGTWGLLSNEALGGIFFSLYSPHQRRTLEIPMADLSNVFYIVLHPACLIQYDALQTHPPLW